MALFSKTPGPRSADRAVDTVIGAEAAFDGELKTGNSVCIEGRFTGRLESGGRVILNPSAHVEADVVAEYVTVNGTLVGNVEARQQLDLGATGCIRGDVRAGAVTVARGGVLEGTCRKLEPVPASAAERTGAKTGEKPAAGTGPVALADKAASAA